MKWIILFAVAQMMHCERFHFNRFICFWEMRIFIGEEMWIFYKKFFYKKFHPLKKINHDRLKLWLHSDLHQPGKLLQEILQMSLTFKPSHLIANSLPNCKTLRLQVIPTLIHFIKATLKHNSVFLRCQRTEKFPSCTIQTIIHHSMRLYFRL